MGIQPSFLPKTRNLVGILLLIGASSAAKTALINDGAPLTCAVGDTCTWTLKEGTKVGFNGNTGSVTCSPDCNSASSVTFKAPSTYTPQNVSVGGCEVLPNDTVWNTPIDHLPVHPNSATWVANLHKATPAEMFGSAAWGTSVATASSPTKALTLHYAPPNTPSVNYPFFQVGNLDGTMMRRESGNFRPVSTGDQHIMTVQRDNCRFFESYNDYLDGTTLKCHSDERTTCNASSAISYAWSNYQRVDPVTGEMGTDAAGFPLAPLVPHLSEFRSGAIHHAMRFTGCVGCRGGGIWPSFSSDPGIDPKTWGPVPPYGARFRLNADWYESNKTKFPKGTQVFLTALRDYGMFLSDVGSNFEVTMDTDLNLDPAASAALSKLHVPMTAFDIVDESSFIAPNSGGLTNEVNPANEYNKPVNYAVLLLSHPRNKAVMVPIAVQPVTIGLSTGPRAVIQSGVSAYKLAWWVNGSSNQKVSWALVSGVGSVSTDGIYCPPVSTDGGTKAVLKGVSAADPNQSAELYLTIIPSGTIRVDTGARVPTKDGNGNIWLADLGLTDAAYYQQQGDFPWPWFDMAGHSAVERSQYETRGYTYGYDIVYKFIVPNGNYSIRLMFGQGRGNCGQNCIKHQYSSPMHLESNGQIFIHDFSFEGGAANYMAGIPQDAFISARVTNNTLYVALRSHRSQGDDHTLDVPGLSGLVISSDSETAPHWAIDCAYPKQPFGEYHTEAFNTTGQPGGLYTVPVGGSLNLYAVDVFTGDSDLTTPHWSIKEGPGSLKMVGGVATYTAPTGLGSSEHTALIEASGAHHKGEISIHITD